MVRLSIKLWATKTFIYNSFILFLLEDIFKRIAMNVNNMKCKGPKNNGFTLGQKRKNCPG